MRSVHVVLGALDMCGWSGGMCRGCVYHGRWENGMSCADKLLCDAQKIIYKLAEECEEVPLAAMRVLDSIHCCQTPPKEKTKCTKCPYSDTFTEFIPADQLWLDAAAQIRNLMKILNIVTLDLPTKEFIGLGKSVGVVRHSENIDVGTRGKGKTIIDWEGSR
ncbi:hypothetical protein FACS1894184_09270 [Clostridia bacterium]|nr:hypothetical protein FACS1894184_09270 [Clostridia bacterium]